MKVPYISVVVPVYNAEKTIERCVNSISGQSFQDLEILLIDDGSKDESGSICDRLAGQDERIMVVHKANQGVSATRNKGMEMASGKYLLFVDCDDYLPKDYCEAMVKAREEQGEDVYCWTALQIVSENHSVGEQMLSYEDAEYSLADRRDVLKFSARYLLNSPVNKLYRMQVIRQNGLKMDETISIAEDLLFNLCYLEAVGNCRIVLLNKVAYFYVRNGQASLDHGYRPDYYKIHKRVLGALWQYCKEWQVPAEDIPLYYKRYWEYMQNALANLDCAGCPLSRWKRFWEKSRIVADRHFQKSVNYMRHTMGRGSFLALKSRCYALVWLYDRVRG